MKQLPPENIYGHTKKLKYILSKVAEYSSSGEKPLNLLDFGCGNGSAISQYLIQDHIQYYGVDIHQPSLTYANEHFGNDHTVFLDHVPQDVKFDIMVYSDVLEHVYHPLDLLKSHTLQLKDDGIVIGSIPNGYGPFEQENRLAELLSGSYTEKLYELFIRGIKRYYKIIGHQLPEFGEKEIPYNSDSGHVQFYTKRSINEILKEVGLSIIDFQNGSFIGAPPVTAWIFVGEKMGELNSKIADFVPSQLASMWYFTARKKTQIL